ncbi:hypothetical protein [Sphingomonas sp.]|jgi:hypothetical protein|uniref:hypothetical protein n=1 Tax=Sphingomonas sp. TaxID=28214 RepID=UPI0035C7DDA4
MRKMILIAALAATALGGTTAAIAGQVSPAPADTANTQPQAPDDGPGMGGPRMNGHYMGGPGGGMMMRADADHDGVITRAEVIAEADRAFADMDANHDGKVTPDERRAFRDARREQREARHAARRDGGEMPPPPPPGARPDRAAPPPHGGEDGMRRERTVTQAQFRDRALRLFDRVDTNHDGRVDQQEREAARMLMRARMIGPNGDRSGGATPPPPPPPGAPDAN